MIVILSESWSRIFHICSSSLASSSSGTGASSFVGQMAGLVLKLFLTLDSGFPTFWPQTTSFVWCFWKIPFPEWWYFLEVFASIWTNGRMLSEVFFQQWRSGLSGAFLGNDAFESGHVGGRGSSLLVACHFCPVALWGCFSSDHGIFPGPIWHIYYSLSIPSNLHMSPTPNRELSTPGTKSGDWGGLCGCIAQQRAGNHEPQDTWVLLKIQILWVYRALGLALFVFWVGEEVDNFQFALSSSQQINLFGDTQTFWGTHVMLMSPNTGTPMWTVSKVGQYLKLPSPEENLQKMPAKSQESAAL